MNYPIKILSQLRPILRGFRKARHLTQAELAKKLGITQQSYAQLEANPASASLERLFKVLQLLEVDLVLADKPIEEKINLVELVNSLNFLGKNIREKYAELSNNMKLTIEEKTNLVELVNSLNTLGKNVEEKGAVFIDKVNMLGKDIGEKGAELPNAIKSNVDLEFNKLASALEHLKKEKW